MKKNELLMELRRLTSHLPQEEADRFTQYYSEIISDAMEDGMSEEEADYEGMAERLLAKGIGHVVIKAGEKGCYAASPEDYFSIPALEVPVVDTTGAGDNLMAGFMDALLRGQSFRECCEAGIRTAADSVQHLGATE